MVGDSAAGVRPVFTASASSVHEPRPFLTGDWPNLRAMPQAAAIARFPTERTELAAVRLALACIVAADKTPLDVARCGVNLRRAVSDLKTLKPRDGAPTGENAIAELRRACAACGRCAGI